MRVIIIEDEPDSIDILSNLLSLLHPELLIIGTAGSVQDGIELLSMASPDLVFLDVKLGDGMSFEILEALEHINFSIVFISAYEKFAIRAFEFSAINYLTKPLDPDKLAQAIQQVKSRRLEKEAFQEKIVLKETIENIKEGKLPSKISIRNSEGIHYLLLSDITYLKVEQGVTFIYRKENNRVSLAKNLVYFEDLFKPYTDFLRVHKSYIINLRYLNTLTYKSEAVLSTGEKIPVATRHIETIKNRI